MTLAQLVGKTTLALFLFSAWKIFFFHYLNSESVWLLIVFYVVAGVIAVAVVRRMGVLNFLENFLILILWLVSSLLIDYFVVKAFLDTDIWRDIHFWLGYLVIISAALLFHKKRHVEIRKGHIEF